MRTALLLSLLAATGCIRESAPAESIPEASGAAPEAPAGVALVELYTSEGCSSCPPADDALARLVAEDRPGVIALAFHVDYWDRLGWRDPFGLPEFSARQRRLAPTLDGRVYTPQAVVNGTVGFVGSREPTLHEAVDAALAEPVTVPLALSASREGNRVTVTPEASGAVPEGARLHVALVQREAQTAVTRGENGGRTLDHTNVVRDLQVVSPEAETVPLAVPPDAGAVFVAAWLQPGE
ncbi:MAG: DUF1223 domain-containing protein, partial [Bacteroidota bacterium]